MKNKKIVSLAALLIASATATQAQIIISEVDPNGSGTTTYGQDWFELENTGTSAVDITGWKMDDSSDLFTDAVSLRGITSIAAGQTVVFLEDGATSANDATLDANFANAWFGNNVPAGLTLANYGGSGVGLSSSGDAVNIFNSTGTAITGVTFGATTLGATLDNSAGVDGAISQSSVVGVNGAFSDGMEIGSPGNVTPTPEPSTLALAGFGGFMTLIGLRRLKNSNA
jgi:Lamin Tail Domain/PEP-CTERM motif